MIEYKEFFTRNRHTKLATLETALRPHIEAGLSLQRYGDLIQWYEALSAMPNVLAEYRDLEDGVSIGKPDQLTPEIRSQIERQLRALIPWRKGPFNVFGIDLDTEWRSDWKWDRVAKFFAPLKGRTILDVGCGNGYYALRMAGLGARQVLGIDPSPRFVVQFYMLKHFLGDIPVDVLPVPLEALPANLGAFDTTFSMGVLYHRRSPMDHLKELKDTLRPGGQLVLETLVVEGPLGYTLVPEGRYAMMNNVWFLPSPLTLQSWLRKCGFQDVELVDETITSTDEQRVTEWMQYHSLKDFLDPTDPSRTAEGHPAPRRAIFIATKPS